MKWLTKDVAAMGAVALTIGLFMALSPRTPEPARQPHLVGFEAALPGGSMLVLYSGDGDCRIEEVASVVPNAGKGVQYQGSGYVNQCWWQDAGGIYVVSEMGTKRVLDHDAVRPIYR